MTWTKRHWGGFCQKIKELWRELWRWVRSWSLFHTVIVMILICLAALAGVWSLWYGWAHIWSSQTNTTVNLDTASLATVGGFGGLVALIVAYRKQAMNERNEVDGKLTDAVHLLGEDKPSTRIAGVYALANVGDQYPDRRQQIVNILCGYLRTERSNDGPTEATIIATLQTELSKDSWTKNQDIDLDLHDATITEIFNLHDIKIHFLVFDDATFNDARFYHITFKRARFDHATFNDARFYHITFNDAWFDHATFDNARFHDATFNFARFNNARFNDARFYHATFKRAWFDHATFNDARFYRATFNNARFHRATFNNDARFHRASLNDAWFYHATFNNAWFNDATFDNENAVERIRKNATFINPPTFRKIRYKNDDK